MKLQSKARVTVARNLPINLIFLWVKSSKCHLWAGGTVK